MASFRKNLTVSVAWFALALACEVFGLLKAGWSNANWMNSTAILFIGYFSSCKNFVHYKTCWRVLSLKSSNPKLFKDHRNPIFLVYVRLGCV